LQSPADITFAERGFPTLLAPNRDVGFQLHGKALNGTLEYALGVYNGVPTGGSGDEDENSEKDVIGRLFARPFQPLEVPVLEDLGLGIAIEHGTEDGALPVHRSASQQVVFEYPDAAVAAGDRLIVAPQAYLAVGPAALLAEYAFVEERVSDGTASAGVESEAWQVAASVVVYGGRPSYQGVKVDAPLDPEAGSLGAFEVGARYNELRIAQAAFTFADPAASVRRASAWAAVGTWYFARRVRAQAHYERTTFRGGAAAGARSSEGVLVARLQVAF
jgi:phosphate-selective porin OprO/OprP